ncbi:MAG TPA: energy-coupling factor transporter ATPase [Candidatus Limnocylindrales bacterium]|nr:energy-coupling factor transporter ATPase [Candidatus Limnocylindrales bacterium]
MKTLDTLIRVNNLHFSYQTGTSAAVKALNSINMAVYRGEMLAITGQNGSGKSTLARHFNGLLTSAEGEVIVDGLSTADIKNTAAIRKIVGMVFQNPDNQLVNSIVEEDVAFGPENLGLPQDEIQERVNWALQVMHLENLRCESLHRLSEGQKKQVAIAGVLAMKPRCIVLDEPTVHLDPRGKRQLLESIVRLNREENITIIILTHSMDEVIHCDRMIVMNMGAIKMHGTPRKVFQQTEQIMLMGLDLPVATQLAIGLHQKGYAISPDIIHPEELIENICRL